MSGPRMEAGWCALAKLTKLWLSLLIALVLAQTAASLLMPRGDGLTIASDLIQGGLLLVATAAFLANTSRLRCATLHIRLFWILMSVGMIFWLTYQGMWNYFEVFKRQDVPNPFLGDVVLFLHLVPMIAALAVLPFLPGDALKIAAAAGLAAGVQRLRRRSA